MLLKQIQETVEKREQEIRDRQEKERARKAAEYREQVVLITNAVDKTPLLVELGFDVRMTEKVLFADPIRMPPTISANAVFGDVPLKTTLVYGGLSTDKGFFVKITIRCEGEDVFRSFTVNFDPDEITRKILFHAEDLFGDVKKARAERAKLAIINEEKRKLASYFHDKAQAFLDEWTLYEARKTAWKEEEQAKAWEPWAGYEIWPNVVPVIITEGEPSHYPLLLVLEKPWNIASKLQSGGIAQVTVVSMTGAASIEWIVGFWRAQERRFDAPTREYHRQFRFGQSYYGDDYIFGSPLIDYKPAPCPEKPLFWQDWIEVNVPRLDGIAYQELREFMYSHSAADCVAVIKPED